MAPPTLGYTLPLLVEADLTIVNLECVIASTSRPWSRWPKAFHFRADPLAIDALRRAGVDCVVLANNHVLDYEGPALLEMLERNGLAFAGAGGAGRTGCEGGGGGLHRQRAGLSGHHDDRRH